MTSYELAKQVWENCIAPDALANGYTAQDAAADLDNFRADGWDIPGDITPEEFAAAMNDVVEESQAKWLAGGTSRRGMEDTMTKIDYALYTELERNNDRADWFDSRDEAIEAARDAILNDGVDPDVVGIMAFEHNGDALWDFEIRFDALGRCWCDDPSALEL